jgi:hypothetical protein
MERKSSEYFAKAENVYQIFHPFYCIMKYLGITPLSFISPIRDGVLGVTWLNFFLVGIKLSLYCALIMLTYFYGWALIKVNFVLETGWRCSSYVGLTACIANVVFHAVKRNNIIKFLKTLNDFDVEVCLNFYIDEQYYSSTSLVQEFKKSSQPERSSKFQFENPVS